MLDFELLKKHVSLIFFWDVFVDPKKRVLGGRCFYFFRIKEDKRRWGRKGGGDKRRWERKRRGCIQKKKRVEEGGSVPMFLMVGPTN